jgi:nucleotide-binding universal stress UspA family protein
MREVAKEQGCMLLTKDSPAVYTRTARPIRSILVATDLSPSSRCLERYATDIAQQYDASVHFLYVVSSLGYTLCGPDVAEQARQLAIREMDDLKTKLVCSGVLKGLRSHFSVDQGDIAERIEDYARAEDIDLVVIGTHCREGLPRLVLRSLQQQILRRTRHPVLSVNIKMSGPRHYSNNIDHVLFATGLGAGSRLGLGMRLRSPTSLGQRYRCFMSFPHLHRLRKIDRPNHPSEIRLNVFEHCLMALAILKSSITSRREISPRASLEPHGQPVQS